MHPHAQSPPPLDTLGYRLAVRQRGIVQDHSGEWVRTRVGKVIQRRDDLGAAEGAGRRVEIGLIGSIQQAQPIESLATTTGQFVGYPRWLPGRGHPREQVKPGGINVENLHLAPRLGRLQPG
jgi:hypothetical protein